MISIKDLKKSFGDAVVLRDIDLEVAEGEIVVIAGSSGSGKSTLLRCINALEVASGGSIVVDDIEVTSERADLNRLRKNVGMVFQQFNLFPHLSVLENIKLAPKKLRKLSDVQATRLSMKLLAEVGLKDKAHARPSQLSGGQKQRVAIARALAMEPKVLLCDEMTSALDPEMVGEVLDVVRRVAGRGMTMLIVTHEMKFARDMGTRMLFLHEGRIVEDGTPSKVIDHPKSARAQQFFRRH